MMASLFAGVSGLKNHQVKMNVIGNNIANINTIGYKPARVNFQEALVQTFKGAGRPSSISGGTNPVQLGLGMQVAAIDNLFLQGGLETTGQITDLAIQGSGFFVLGDGNDNRFYTRAGAFGFDAASNLVDPATGLMVMGKMADATGNISSIATTGPITMPFGQQDPASATSEITLSNNLDASATDSAATLRQAGSSGVLSVGGTATDGVGGTHVITITGIQALASSASGTITGLTNSTTLSSLGVTIFDDFQITIDGTRTESVTGMNATSTVSDLVQSLNQIVGITASLVEPPGRIQISRDKAGDPVQYGFASSTATAGNIVQQLFGGAFTSTGGAAHTFVATDTFSPTTGNGIAAGPVTTDLTIETDQFTGLAVGLSGVGGGGITVTASSSTGIAAAPVGQELIIDTAATTHTTSLQVFDSQGGRHTLSIEFFKSIVPNRWEWTASTLGDETVVAGGSGYVAFNQDGSLSTFDYNGGASAIIVDPRNGALNIDVAVMAGTSGNYDGLTGFASGNHTAAMIAQNGYGLGILEKIAIDQAGNISGIFSNGITRILAQIMLADFTNQAGLRKAGRSYYQPTPNSGVPVEGVAGETISGTLSSGALESSAVDIAAEFTSMITAQRGFQANARIITTSDSMLDELVNIKR
ncbi:MAG: flagellar hook protein FlgE [Candidatus Zixiibacteriota bacterium]